MKSGNFQKKTRFGNFATSIIHNPPPVGQHRQKGETMNYNLKLAMLEANIESLAELARKAELSYPTVHNFAHGKAPMSIESAKKLAKALEISWTEIGAIMEVEE